MRAAHLWHAHLEGANLSGVDLTKASLRGASFDAASRLEGVRCDQVSLAQVAFDSASLTGIDWTTVHMLGDEIDAARHAGPDRQDTEYRTAARAYHALSVMLSAQGITEAKRFSERSKVMQRKARWCAAQLFVERSLRRVLLT